MKLFGIVIDTATNLNFRISSAYLEGFAQGMGGIDGVKAELRTADAVIKALVQQKNELADSLKLADEALLKSVQLLDKDASKVSQLSQDVDSLQAVIDHQDGLLCEQAAEIRHLTGEVERLNADIESLRGGGNR